MKRPPHRKAAGFSMIEVLITLVVLAFGLLGLGLLQTMNLRYTKSADQRTQAINLGSELLDMMRTNRTERSAYAMAQSNFDSVSVPVPKGCASIEVLGAAGNVARWQCEVKETLGPDAYAVVAFDAADKVKVTVNWDESWDKSGTSTIDDRNEITLETLL